MTTTKTDENETIAVTVQTEVKPSFRFEYEVGDDETPEEARKRAHENAKHDASVALAETAHEYDWEPTDE